MKLASLHNSSRNNDDGLYHRDIGFPKNWVNMLPRQFNPSSVNLNYGSHAKREAMSDRYGNMELPATLEFSKTSGIKIIEMEVSNGTVSKLVVRKPYDKTKDIIIVFNPDDGFVRTVWFNESNDKHKTLDKRNYKTPA